VSSDPFFDPLVARPSDDERPARSDASPPDGEVDEWFERAASGRAGGSPGQDGGPSPSEQLGAAALPLEGDLVRPARRQRSLRRAPEPALPTEQHERRSSLPKPESTDRGRSVAESGRGELDGGALGRSVGVIGVWRVL